MSYTWQWILAVTILCLTTTAAYIKHKHTTLEAKITRRTISHQERRSSHTSTNLQSLPPTLLLTNPIKPPALFHEKCSILLPNYTISDSSPEHFTHLLRHNMINFAHYPQAWILWLLLPEQRHTFSRAYIERLVFVEGDLVCDVYKVVEAKPTHVEMSMEMPPRFGSVAGLLVIRLETMPESGGVELVTETLQWATSEEGTMRDLPLCKPLPKLLHEFASASLLVSGAGLLRSLDDL